MDQFIFRDYVLDVPVVGMTTVCKSEATDFARRVGVGDGGFAEVEVHLHAAGSDGASTKRGIAVTYQGVTVGYLAHGFPGSEQILEGGVRPAQMQLFGRMGANWLKLSAYVWCGDGPPQWKYSREYRPPMNSAEKLARDIEQAVARLEQFVAKDPDFYANFRRGCADERAAVSLNKLAYGALKEGRESEALYLVQLSFEGISKRTTLSPYATPTVQLANTVLKKLELDAPRLSVLDWWLSLASPDHRKAAANIEREAEALRGKGVSAIRMGLPWVE